MIKSPDSDLFENQQDNILENMMSLKSKELSPLIEKIITKKDLSQLPLLISLRKHSSVQIRRKIAKSIGLLGTKDNLENLLVWKNEEHDKDTCLLLESTILKIQGINTRNIDDKNENQIYKVNEVIKLMKSLIQDSVFFIEGEISQPQYYGQMLYFALKDDQETRIDCRVLSFKLNKINFPINEGLQVIIKGSFNLSKGSKLVFDVDFIKLTGEGELARNLKELEDKLKNEGLFDETRKRSIPPLPRNLLLIASPNSAAIDDFTKVLFARRAGGISIYLLPIKTQGVSAEQEILDQISKANEIISANFIDIVVITRGGGSKDDLAVFNSEKVVRAIHSISKPTIVAIGHERDITLSELVADKRASTPSNAAELASLTSSEIINKINNQFQVSINNTHQRLKNANQIKEMKFSNIINSIKQHINNYKLTISNINYYAKAIIENTKFTLGNKIFSIHNIISKNISEINSSMNTSVYISESKTIEILTKYKHNLEVIIQKIDANNPKFILNKGYSLIKQNGVHIQSKYDLKTNVRIDVTFKDGDVKI